MNKITLATSETSETLETFEQFKTMKSSIKKIGVVGSGFIARGFMLAMQNVQDFAVSKVLTRRPIASCWEFPRSDVMTNSLDELIDHSDLIVECSGDVLHATEVVNRAFQAGLPVVTMNSEFHVTTGSFFVDKGYLTEAEGDQPGCLAALHEDAVQMGFRPLVFGNVKGFYDPNPSLENMQFWSRKQRLTLGMVTAATDGTKMQYEQALIANGLNATILQTGMLGPQTKNFQECVNILAEEAKRLGQAISDYTVIAKSHFKIFLIAEHDEVQQQALDYFKLGEGPYYSLFKNHILCHLEIPKTIRRAFEGRSALLNNSSRPTVSIAAIAKKKLSPGESIPHGMGSFSLRGVTVKMTEHPGHMPLGLVHNALVKRTVEPEQILTFQDLEIPDSLALRAWEEIRKVGTAPTFSKVGAVPTFPFGNV